MTLENSKFVTNMQSNINEATIESIYAQIIRKKNYSHKKIQNRCKDSQLIIKIILYLIIREGDNISQIIRLQFYIKKIFVLLPGLPKFDFNPKRSQRNFLQQTLLLSQIIYRCSQILNIKKLQLIDPQTIFIIIMFLSTDKLVSSKCYKLIHERLQKTPLPFRKQKNTQQMQSLQQFVENYEAIEVENFKRELRSIIFSQKEQKKCSIKNHSVGLMISRFYNKENVCHHQLNKILRENITTQRQDFCRVRKCFQQQRTHFTEIGQQQQKKLKQFTWSKCELMKRNYVPFSIIKAPTAQKTKSTSNSYLKFKKIRQRTVFFQEKRHELVLKI